MPTQEEIQKLQGTRLSEKAPWETYDSEMGSKLNPELEEAVKRYEERMHTKASSETLEELARQKEINNALAGNYQWVKPEEYAEVAPRIGRIMHSTVFINKLRTECGLKCWYTQHGMPRRLTLKVQVGNEEPQTACWVQEGFMPEYSIMKFDEHGVPLDERMRGWRTPLLQLLIKGIVSEKIVEQVFGKATGPASKKFNELLYNVRNRRVLVKEDND